MWCYLLLLFCCSFESVCDEKLFVSISVKTFIGTASSVCCHCVHVTSSVLDFNGNLFFFSFFFVFILGHWDNIKIENKNRNDENSLFSGVFVYFIRFYVIFMYCITRSEFFFHSEWPSSQMHKKLINFPLTKPPSCGIFHFNAKWNAAFFPIPEHSISVDKF